MVFCGREPAVCVDVRREKVFVKVCGCAKARRRKHTHSFTYQKVSLLLLLRSSSTIHDTFLPASRRAPISTKRERGEGLVPFFSFLLEGFNLALLMTFDFNDVWKLLNKIQGKNGCARGENSV